MKAGILLGCGKLAGSSGRPPAVGLGYVCSRGRCPEAFFPCSPIPEICRPFLVMLLLGISVSLLLVAGGGEPAFLFAGVKRSSGAECRGGVLCLRGLCGLRDGGVTDRLSMLFLSGDFTAEGIVVGGEGNAASSACGVIGITSKCSFPRTRSIGENSKSGSSGERLAIVCPGNATLDGWLSLWDGRFLNV